MRKESSIIATAVAATAGVVGDIVLPDASSASAIEVFVEATGLVSDTLSVNLVTYSANGTGWDAVGVPGVTLTHSASKTQLVLNQALDAQYSVEYLLPGGSADTVTLAVQVVYTYP
jgi:hypothetical protein